jgi:hypothetical protein
VNSFSLNAISSKPALRSMALFGLGALGISLGGCDTKYYFRIESVDYFAPLVLRTTKGNIVEVGYTTSNPPAPVPTTRPSKLPPLLGDRALCDANSELTDAELANKNDIIRRLNGILGRLQNGGAKGLFAGEQNTLKETPECGDFKVLTDAIDVLLGGGKSPVPPNPGPIRSGINISDIDFEDGRDTMVLYLTNGQKVNLNVEDAFDGSGIPSYGSVPAAKTGQGVGVEFERTKDDTRYSSRTENRYCTYTYERRVCDRSNVCYIERVEEPGTQTNTIDTTNYSYDYNVELTNTQVQKVANMKLHVWGSRDYTNFGPCNRL